MNDLIFFFVAFLAEIIGTMAGFGSSTILMPFALFIFDFRTTLTLVAFFHLSGSAGRIIFFHKSINTRLLVLFGIPGVIFTFIGAILVRYISSEFLELFLGVFLLSYVFISFLNPEFSIEANRLNSTAGGILSGFISGIIGTGGIIKSAFLTSFKLEKSVYIATAASISFIIDIIRISIYLSEGYLSSQYYIYIPVLFTIALIGSFIGKNLVSMVSEKRFRVFVLVIIALMSLKFIFDGISKVFGLI